MEKTVKIVNEEGLHARPAGNFAKAAGQFKADIQLEANGQTANGKSIMSIMSLGLTKGTDLKITADGEDAEEALKTLSQIVANKFAAPAAPDDQAREAHA